MPRLRSWPGFGSKLDSVVVFGSRASGRYRSASDLDLALKGTVGAADILALVQDDLDPGAEPAEVADEAVVPLHVLQRRTQAPGRGTARQGVTPGRRQVLSRDHAPLLRIRLPVAGPVPTMYEPAGESVGGGERVGDPGVCGAPASGR